MPKHTTAGQTPMNKFQKKARKKGEYRISKSDIPHFLDLAQSDNPKDRFEAAANLCPCHVRTRISDVQTALFKLMEDPDDDVRARAWHTLEDGGVPDDPRMDAIFERARQNETDKRILGFMKQVIKENLDHKERTMLKIAARPEYDQIGKCDFCGTSNAKVKTDYETEIPNNGHKRLALVCQNCAG